MRILVAGDFHIPGRALKIPDAVWTKMVAAKPELVLLTGDFTEHHVLEKFEDAFPEVHACQGNMDPFELPELVELKIEGSGVLLIHGDQVRRGDPSQLAALGREHDAALLVNGHTHRLHIEARKGVLIVNPGSATGCWAGDLCQPAAPSFILLDLAGRKAVIRKAFPDREETEKHELEGE